MSFSFDEPSVSAVIIENGFFPRIAVKEFIKNWRLPSDYGDDLVRTVLVLAMGYVNESLTDFRQDMQSKGFLTLEGAGDELNIVHYKRAVFSKAKDELLTNYAGIEKEETSSEILRNYSVLKNGLKRLHQESICYFTGEPVFKAELL
ncbi:head completion/stabilization protein [Pseudomonas sp. HK3]